MAEEGGGSEQTEVRIRLIIDDQASATAKAVEEGMKKIDEETKKTSIWAKEWKEALHPVAPYVEAIAGTAAAATAAFAAAAGMAEILGHSAIEAASEAAIQERATSGLLTMLDREKNTYADIHEYVRDVREELENTAIKTGVATDQVVDMYNAMIERGGMGSEKAKELTDDVALVGKIARGGAQGLAEGFSMMELGIVRARNPLVQLIAATDTLHGNAKSVAQQLQKMTPEDQIELAEKAIAKQAELMKASGSAGPAALTLPELRQSFANIREQGFDAMGRPMLDSLIPQLTRLQNFLIDNKERILEFATEVGTKFASFIDAVGAAAEGIYDGFRDDWDYIKTGFDDLFGDWARAWESAMDDTSSIKTEFASMTDNFIRGMQAVLAAFKATAEVAMDINDELHNRHFGTTQANIARDALVGTQSAVGKGGDEEFYKRVDEYRKKALNAMPDVGPGHDEGVKVMEENIAAAVEQHEQWKKLAAESTNSAEAYADAFERAHRVHAEGFERSMLETLHGSENARHTLEVTAQNVGIGFDELMKTVSSLDPKLAEEIRKSGKVATEGGVKGAPIANFNNNTFHIHQDFKDQDPDRVAMVFRRDLVKHALANTQARTANAFGPF